MNLGAQRHTLSDWLGLHELEPPLCREILTALEGQVSGVAALLTPAPKTQPLSVEAAWSVVVDAMLSFFPMHAALIAETFEHSSRIQVEGSTAGKRALTLVSSDGDYPKIVYRYDGTASDIMVIAHEFAHALQIVASRGRFVAPVIREVCAFLGEIALIYWFQGVDEARYLELQQVCRADSLKYSLSDGATLLAALNDQAAPYRYDWNYPIARHLSIESSSRYSRDRIWMLFEGSLSVRQLLMEFGHMGIGPA